MAEKLSREEKQREAWRKALTEGFTPGLLMRRVFRALPSSPRCGMCMAPWKGIGGFLIKPLPFSTPSRKNPTWCKVCFEEAPIGGAEVPVGVMFADIRGFTSYSEGRAPEEVARLANRFYSVATDIFSRHDAVIDKLVGDEVMALFLPGSAGGEQYIQKMVSSADALLRTRRCRKHRRPHPGHSQTRSDRHVRPGLRIRPRSLLRRADGPARTQGQERAGRRPYHRSQRVRRRLSLW